MTAPDWSAISIPATEGDDGVRNVLRTMCLTTETKSADPESSARSHRSVIVRLHTLSPGQSQGIVFN